MAVCENCNVDHAEQFKSELPGLYLLEKAFEKIQDAGDDIFSGALGTFCYKTVRENIDDFIEKRLREGNNVREATVMFAANMMVAGFGVGVAVSGDNDYEHYPLVIRDEEEQEDYIAQHLAAYEQVQQQRETMPQIDKEAMMKTLKDAGIIPQDFDGEFNISVMEIPVDGPEFKIGGDEPEPETGMYL